MDDEENQDHLINRNTSHGKNRRQGLFASSDDESEESGSEDEEEDLDEEEGEEEEGSDSEEEDDEDEEEPSLESSGPALCAADINDGLSSDEERENCPICLNGFRDQVVGTPENCNHYFCLDCIVEWSKNANSCPVDRITFSCIHIRAHYGGEILKKVPIQNKNVIVVEEDPTNCEVCGRSDREDRLLLCDGCDAGYHMECLIPALNAVPVDEWFCPECAATNQPDHDHVSEEEVASLLADVIPTTSRLRTNIVRTRAIARTRQSERVRASVNRIRTTARNTQNVPRYLLSSLLDETIETVVAGLNTAVYTRNLTPRPASTRRRRKVGKRGQSKVSKGSRCVGKRRKRRVKKRKGRRQTNRKVPTSHRRIAKSLGICSPTRGTTLPRIQRASEQTLGSMRGDIGAALLSVFGNPNDLDPFDSNEDNDSSLSSPLTAKRRILSRSALRSHQPVARPISVGLSRGGVAPVHDSVAVAEPVPDLLGSILSGQSMLMMKSSDIVISRDGSLIAKKAGNATSQRKTSREAATPADIMEQSPSHSGSPTTTSPNTWKPIEQQPPQPSFPSAGLYSLSPSPHSSSSSLDGLSGHSSSVSGGPTFRLKNAFTPRAVQVHSSVSRSTSKSGEASRFNGGFHKRELPSKNDLAQQKKAENKYAPKPPELRLDISEFPRIPKIKRETDYSPNNEVSKRLETSTNKSSENNPSGPVMNQLTGRGDSKQLGRFSTGENTERNTRQESQAHSRNTGGTASSSNKSSTYSNSSRNIGSSDSGGGGLRITISGGSTNSCRQFSPVSKDPFRNSDGKTPQKTPPPYSTSIKKEKTVKNEIYDPFEPTGSDSGSPISSPERPATPPPPPLPVETTPTTTSTNTSTGHSGGVKVGAFRSFKFTSHSSKVSVSKLGPDFSGMSPTNKEPEESTSQVNASPTLPSFLKLEKEIKKEVIEEETNEHPPFRISCPLGLKITSDLKAGGTRGFHFDIEEEHPVVSIKPDPDVLPNRTSLQSTSTTSSRLVWDAENPHEPKSRTSETQKKKITIKEEVKASSSSTTRPHSRERDSRSASLSNEDKDRERKYKSKSHKAKRARSDRSSSGSCERSKKKRQKERKKEKKRKRSESRERRRSRSSSHSSSSHRAYNSKKKKKKKRDSRSESPGYSISPDKERKRKHKSEKTYSSKELSFKAKERKKSKEDRGKQRSMSPQISKEIKVQKPKDKTYFRDSEITRHIVLSPNNNEKTITCTVSFKTESPTITQETKKSVLGLLKEEEEDEIDPFLYSERKVSIKDESPSEFSDHSFDEKIKLEADSPPWSPSLLDSLLPETKIEDVPEPPSPLDASPVNDLHSGSLVASPQNSPLSTPSDVPSPKSSSPHDGSLEEAVQSASVSPVKKEPDDLQWSPSHLDDLLLNELSDDDVCSVDADSPDDVDLEEAILMKREGDYEEPTIINFSKTAVIPFLQDNENSVETEAGNHINEKTSKSKDSEERKSDELKEKEPTSISKSKPQIKRVTWNLQDKASEKETPDESLSSPLYNTQQDESWSPSEEHTDAKVSSDEPDPSSETSTSVTWTLPEKATQESGQESVSEASWNAGNKLLTHIGMKSDDKPMVHTVDKHTVQAPDRPEKDASQVPWIAKDRPLQVFPQTLPPLPLPPIFPPYAHLSEPTVPCVVQISRTVLSQTPKPGNLATTNEPKIKAASTGEVKGKSKLKKEEKDKNDEYMKKLHIQERAVEEVKLAIKPYYQKREITKEEYKDILRKAVQKICHSKSGEINPVKVVNLVKGYVDRYKHIRNKSKKSGEDHDSPV
ncbi:PREDICTED: PHD and RING finger domain-containing protein 1 [Nanorana parkeri]|uniref:PHD and RING finger domain-containing protein 1 n=1 Tax=Nanorana parkeri TaxID=125878 RepID=UPI000854A1A3|nr:PREDICTED: PHD and RING finger domain-containing protein 1 [Nanorana parkeri]